MYVSESLDGRRDVGSELSWLSKEGRVTWDGCLECREEATAARVGIMERQSR